MASRDRMQLRQMLRLGHDRDEIAGCQLKNAVLQIGIESCERCPSVAWRNDFPEGCESNGVREFVAIQRGDGDRLPRLSRPALCSGGMSVAAEQRKQKAGISCYHVALNCLGCRQELLRFGPR